jgi:outer membrane biosynthesis protein TonB
MPGDIYVNEPMPLSKLFKARKPEPKPRPEPPAATITGVRSTPMPEPKQQAQETTTGAPRAAETAAPVRRAADAERDVIVVSCSVIRPVDAGRRRSRRRDTRRWPIASVK